MMKHIVRAVLVALLGALCLEAALAQAPRVIPRPPPSPPQGSAPELGSIATDGYAPIPARAGQTRAPRPDVVAAYEVQTFATGLAGGFSFHFLPDGRLLVAERPGRVKLIGLDGHVSQPLGGLPPIWAQGPQGLVEALPDRDFARNRVLYLAYTVRPEGSPEPPPREAGLLVVARARLSADERTIEDVKVLLNAEGPGGRVIQARDGTLLVASSIPAGVGIDSSDWPQPQQLDSLMGKVLRINTDGSIPRDNPFVGRAGARPEIYAYGFRDDAGVAIHPRTGKLWASEHGPKGGDEINAIEKGKNYGFPVIGYGHEYNGKPINHDRTVEPGMEQPVYFWTPDIAPSGMSFYTGKLFPAWQGNLFVAALAGKHLARLVLNGERVIGEERLLANLDQRIRDVQQGPDGLLYALTEEDDGALLRFEPVQ